VGNSGSQKQQQQQQEEQEVCRHEAALYIQRAALAAEDEGLVMW
jgi:hypothetical protein